MKNVKMNDEKQIVSVNVMTRNIVTGKEERKNLFILNYADRSNLLEGSLTGKSEELQTSIVSGGVNVAADLAMVGKQLSILSGNSRAILCAKHDLVLPVLDVVKTFDSVESLNLAQIAFNIFESPTTSERARVIKAAVKSGVKVGELEHTGLKKSQLYNIVKWLQTGIDEVLAEKGIDLNTFSHTELQKLGDNINVVKEMDLKAFEIEGNFEKTLFNKHLKEKTEVAPKPVEKKPVAPKSTDSSTGNDGETSTGNEEPMEVKKVFTLSISVEELHGKLIDISAQREVKKADIARLLNLIEVV